MKKLIILILFLCLPVFAKGNRQDDPSYQIKHDRTNGYTPTEHYTVEEQARLMGLSAGYIPYITSDYLFASSNLYYDSVNGRIGINTIPSYTLDVLPSANITALFGGDNDAQLRTDSHLKYARLAGAHYDNDEQPMAFAFLLSYDVASIIRIGGGSSLMNTATMIEFYTAADTVTTTGTRRVTINSAGQVGIDIATFIGTELLRVNGNEYLDGELQIASTGKVISGSKTLTDGSATGIFEVAIPSNTSAGGTISYSIKCFDGTDLQNHSGLISFAGVNKGGTVTSDIDEVYLAASETKVVTAGTLTDAWTITDGAGKITINLNANTSLTPTSFVVFYTITLNGNEVVTKL